MLKFFLEMVVKSDYLNACGPLLPYYIFHLIKATNIGQSILGAGFLLALLVYSFIGDINLLS